MKRLFKIAPLVVAIASIVFSACKKDKSCEGCNSNPPAGSTNKPPVAIAGQDQTITLPTNSASLDGSSSNDPDGSIASWQWTKVSGPSIFTIANAGNVNTRVNNLTGGTYLFELKVRDDKGLLDRDTVEITVLSPTLNGNGIYIAGSGRNTSGKTLARIWKNNAVQDLNDGQYDAIAKSVFVSGSDVYVAGWEANANGKNVAKLWKNGVAHNLSNGQASAEAHSVFVSGNDVYVAGWEVDVSDIRLAKLWKNSVVQNLSNGQTSAEAHSVFVSGNDVFVAGTDADKAVIWKNGVLQQLSTVGEGDAALSVSGNDVYAAGDAYYCCPASQPQLWKNGVKQMLGSTGNGDGQASAVFVSGSDVFVAGWGHSYGATLWKNGVAQSLGSPGAGNGYANSVFVSGNDVYVVGYEYEPLGLTYVAKLWISGVGYTLSGLNHANSIFVK